MGYIIAYGLFAGFLIILYSLHINSSKSQIKKFKKESEKLMQDTINDLHTKYNINP